MRGWPSWVPGRPRRSCYPRSPRWPRRSTRCSARRRGFCRSRTAPYTDREKWVFAHVPFAKKIYRTRLWLRSESNISVIENGSDKTQEFKGIALSALDATVADERVAPQADAGPPVRLQAAGVRNRLPPGADPTARRGGVEPGARTARALVGDRGRQRAGCGCRWCARRVMPRRTTSARSTSSARTGHAAGHSGATAHTRTWAWRFRDFPNFFMLYGPNTNVGSNSVIFMLEAQAHYIVRALKHMRRKRKTYVAVRPETMADFIARIDEWMQGTVWLTRCSNYFRAANGRVVTQWPRSARAFWGMTRRFRPRRIHLRTTCAPARGRGADPTRRRTGSTWTPTPTSCNDSIPRCATSRRHVPTCRRTCWASSVTR